MKKKSSTVLTICFLAIFSWFIASTVLFTIEETVWNPLTSGVICSFTMLSISRWEQRTASWREKIWLQRKKSVSYSSPGSRLAQQRHTSDQGTGVPSGLGLEFRLVGTSWATSSSTVGFMAGLDLEIMLKLKIGSYSAPRVRLRR